MILRSPVAILACAPFVLSAAGQPGPSPQLRARQILDAAGVKGGLVVHLGCGDGKLTAALRANESYLVHGLDTSPANVGKARAHAQSLGLYGKVSVERLEGDRLPYVDNLVNLAVVSMDQGRVSKEELLRVLCPGGVALVARSSSLAPLRKPRPPNIDEWTHYLHDATNNPVAQDSVVGPPAHLQWVGSPRWSRHHDRMASMSALVSTGDRIFCIMDEGSRACLQLPSKWKLIARDAFNGAILWKRGIAKWHTQLWPLKSGPAQLTRRLVAVGDRVYATLSLFAPVTAMDAATGKTLSTYEATGSAEEILWSEGVLFVLVNTSPAEEAFVPDRSGTWNDTRRVAKEVLWDEKPRQLMAVRADTGESLWQHGSRVAPMTPTVDSKRVYFHDGEKIVALDRATGRKLWQSEPVSRRKKISRNFGPNLIAYQNVLAFTGGDRTMTGLSAETGAKLWSAKHPPSGHASQQDLMVVDGLVWSGAIASGRQSGVFEGLDPVTGKVRSSFAPDVKTYWFHHRCYRSKATSRYLLPSRTGIEFVDFRKKQWTIHHWVRGGCIYGIMPCNGLVYAPPHSCACYLESKLYGLNALAAKRPEQRGAKDGPRHVRGPAYAEVRGQKPEASGTTEWPMYRNDSARSGATSANVSPRLTDAWRTQLGGKLTSVVVANGKVFVASVDTHTLYALDERSGKELWTFTAGGRIDSPPTIYRGTAVFGSADGWVYSLRASDGQLAWRFRAAPEERRIMAFEQIESVWPVHGSVLIQRDPSLGRDVLYCVAGRSMFIDGGLRMLRLDPLNGQKLSETVLNEQDPQSGKNLQAKVEVLNMPVALPDVLSSDGEYMYMRSQRFDLSGKRPEATPLPTKPAELATQQEGEDRHLFCPAGFLDDAWFHRSYWLYGRRYSSGCNWWANAGRYTPAGRLLTFDDACVYGYGRKPSYFQWSVPLDYHLFRCRRDPALRKTPSAGRSEIAVGRSDSLNPAGKPLAVAVWIHATKDDGVILVRGGASHGYGLVLKRGRPAFILRIANRLHKVEADMGVTGRWVHLAGVLTKTKQLQIFVDGRLCASAKAPDFLKADPNDKMEIGTDRGSPLGEYKKAPPFLGRIDEVRIYHRALTPAEVKQHAEGKPSQDATELVLYYSFDGGDAQDDSGNDNHGGVGAVPAEGKFGQAMAFDAGVSPKQGGPSRVSRHFQHQWSHDCPVHVRAMALTSKALFVAGPPDVLDEEEAYRRPHDDDTLKQLAEQDAASNGLRGGLLLAVSRIDGKELARYRLSSPPTWDSLAASPGRLYFATVDGHVVCMRGE